MSPSDTIERPVQPGRRRPPARLGPASSTRWRGSARERLWRAAARPRTTSPRSARSPATRRCRWSRPASRRSTSPAGRSRPTRTSPGRPTPTRASTRRTASRRRAAHQQRAAAAPTRSSWAEGDDASRLVRADRRRRRGRLRRPAQRLRADEGDDRGRRRRRALRGPARLGEEVRPPRRQGARADQRSSSARSTRRGSPPTCSACRPCSSRAPTRLGARCSPATSTSATAPFVTGERTPEGFFRVARGIDARDRPRPRLRAVRRPALVRDLDADLDEARAVRRGDPRASSPASCSPTTARRRSTGSKHLDDADDRARSSASSAAMGYKFQFVTLAGFHALNASMFELARGYADEGMAAYVGCRSASSRSRTTATPRRATSARSAPATSTRSPGDHRRRRARPSRSRARPRRSSSRPRLTRPVAPSAA